MRLREDYLAEQLQNEEFKVAYDEWEPDFEIADALLQFRADNKLTQKKLAKMIGINRSDLNKLESASANPTLKTLKKIASALGVKMDIKLRKVVNRYPKTKEWEEGVTEAIQPGIKAAEEDPDNEITRAVEGYVRTVLANMDTFGPKWP